MLLLKHLRNALMVNAPISLCPRQNLQLAIAGHEPSVYYAAAIGLIRLGSVFLTLPTRTLTGQQIIFSDG